MKPTKVYGGLLIVYLMYFTLNWYDSRFARVVGVTHSFLRSLVSSPRPTLVGLLWRRLISHTLFSWENFSWTFDFDVGMKMLAAVRGVVTPHTQPDGFLLLFDRPRSRQLYRAVMETESNHTDAAPSTGMVAGAGESTSMLPDPTALPIPALMQPSAFPATAPSLTLRLLMMQKVQYYWRLELCFGFVL